MANTTEGQSPALSIQGFLVSKIKEINTEAGSRVYDIIPASPTFPYVRVGEDDETPIDEDCWDRTQTVSQINVWSRAVGFPECKRIAHAIRKALHENEFNISGQTLDRMRVLTVGYSRDPDGITNRARIVLETDTQPV